MARQLGKATLLPQASTREWWSVFPHRKFYTEQMFVLWRTQRMRLRNHADTQTVKRFQR